MQLLLVQYHTTTTTNLFLLFLSLICHLNLTSTPLITPFPARRMDPKVPTPPAASTVTESCISSQAPPSSAAAPNLQLLEISLISAQDLSAISKSMHTYAVAWVQPGRKKTTKIDTQGHKNPTWNNKFAFKLDKELLSSENATVTVEIYTVSWFRDVLIGNVRVLIADLLTPLMRNPKSDHHQQSKTNTRFVALQVRRPSGNPQGILNMGVALIDSSMRSMPLKNAAGKSPVKKFDGKNVEKKEELQPCGLDNLQKAEHNEQEEMIDDDEDCNRDLNAKIQQWRAQSFSTDMNPEDFPGKPGSVYNGSMVNGSVYNGDNLSELCSDIGPSASVVAAELAGKMQPPAEQLKPSRKLAAEGDDTGSSILEELTIEEAKAKGYIVTTKDRWRKATRGGDGDEGGSELSMSNGKSRRGSDGLFSCFGNAYGIEFRIVCGASKNANKGNTNNSSKRKKLPPPNKANTA